jgi:tetratricopeptide (TPR) repeat protein
VGDFKMARIEEIAKLDDGRVPWRPVRHHFGISAFGVNAWTGENDGDRIINEHDEAAAGDGHEELYLVTTGHARFELDGQAVDAPVGTMVFATPGAKRTAFAEEAGTTVVAVGAAPGEAYQVIGWEIWAPVRHLYDAGDYAAAADAAKELIEANPEYPLPFYNLACCESLAGRTEDALEHLRHAVSQSDRLREFAKSDTDLDAIREEPAFRELIV